MFSEMGNNIFYGNNAEGKTNLLEAISLCVGKSFRNSKASSYEPFAQPGCSPLIKLYYESDDYPGRENVVEYKFNNNRAVIKINDITRENAADLYGEMKYVVFIPEQLSLIKEKPELRREYIDNIVMLQNKSHKKIMSGYKKILNHRNTLLNFDCVDLSMLSLWDDMLAKQGINLIFGRLKYLNLLKKYAQEIYREISCNKEELELYYNSTIYGKIDNLNTFDDKDHLYECYIKKLKENLNSKSYSPFRTGVGPHRDDIIFLINNQNAREYGSQGQIRSICLSLKLAQAKMIREYNNETPVLLLDEILSELDNFRRSFVLKNIKNAQVFITSCNLSDFSGEYGEPPVTNQNKIWKVNGGNFELCTFRE